jgi:hypothetical protein
MMELAPKEGSRVDQTSGGPVEGSRANNNSSGDSFLPREQPEPSAFRLRLRGVIKSLLSKYAFPHAASSISS